MTDVMSALKVQTKKEWGKGRVRTEENVCCFDRLCPQYLASSRGSVSRLMKCYFY